MSLLTIGGEEIPAGERRQLALTVAKLYDFTDMKIPVEVVRGQEPGPTLFVSAAIHGDEINGVDIVRRLLKHRLLKSIKGTLIAIPIVNVFGFNDKSRYLPDRRDLNRSFPGAEHGSLASQIAYMFRTEIVSQSTHGIDLHTGAIHRRNLPQIRADLSQPHTLELASAFGAPVILDASPRDGSLREMVDEKKIPMLLYEAGTALRFDHRAALLGVEGILNVMRHIGMLPPLKLKTSAMQPYIARSSQWVRAPISGIFVTRKKLGERVVKGDKLGFITNPFGDYEYAILSPLDGVIIGNSILPLANEGDGIYHIATFDADHKMREEELYPYIDPDLM
ncbi:MAG: succinylglutamate desuccinylase/aspartoacylase family protein [Alphaproteobacteria bacterium]|nr:succinylglutamate desuccinylase/aspartoacylase family protein [Alphaproteobacteria bacterium]